MVSGHGLVGVRELREEREDYTSESRDRPWAGGTDKGIWPLRNSWGCVHEIMGFQSSVFLECVLQSRAQLRYGCTGIRCRQHLHPSDALTDLGRFPGLPISNQKQARAEGLWTQVVVTHLREWNVPT